MSHSCNGVTGIHNAEVEHMQGYQYTLPVDNYIYFFYLNVCTYTIVGSLPTRCSIVKRLPQGCNFSMFKRRVSFKVGQSILNSLTYQSLLSMGKKYWLEVYIFSAKSNVLSSVFDVSERFFTRLTSVLGLDSHLQNE